MINVWKGLITETYWYQLTHFGYLDLFLVFILCPYKRFSYTLAFTLLNVNTEIQVASVVTFTRSLSRIITNYSFFWLLIFPTCMFCACFFFLIKEAARWIQLIILISFWSTFLSDFSFTFISRNFDPRISNVEENLEKWVNWKDMVGISFSFHKFPH